jgi:hypothetical protein
MSNSQNSNSSQGYSFSISGLAGMCFAAYLSYTLGNPIGWNVIHFVFGWFYILYLCGGCGGGIPAGVF